MEDGIENLINISDQACHHYVYLNPYAGAGWHMGTHLRLLSESYQMNTNMTGFRWFSKKSLHPCNLDESSLSICLTLPGR